MTMPNVSFFKKRQVLLGPMEQGACEGHKMGQGRAQEGRCVYVLINPSGNECCFYSPCFTPGNCVEVQGIKQSFMWKTRRCDEKYPHVKRAICQVMFLAFFVEFVFSFNFFYFCCYTTVGSSLGGQRRKDKIHWQKILHLFFIQPY